MKNVALIRSQKIIMSAVLVTASQVMAQYVPIYAGPAYDEDSGVGYQYGLERPVVNSSGLAVISVFGGAEGDVLGNRVMAMTKDGVSYEMKYITTTGGPVNALPHGLNESGIAVGEGQRYSAGKNTGYRAIRWSSTGAAMQLQPLGSDSFGSATAAAWDINNAGLSVGNSTKYVGSSNNGVRAVLWSAAGVPTELGTLNRWSVQYANDAAKYINEGGQIAGVSAKFDTSGQYDGNRPVRWNSAGQATELPIIWVDGFDGRGSATVSGLNEGGVIIGNTTKYISANSVGTRGLRWDVDNSVHELTLPRLDAIEATATYTGGINDVGQIFGTANIPMPSGLTSTYPVRWEANGTPTLLPFFEPDSLNRIVTVPVAMNRTGELVGSGYRGSSANQVAAYWRADGTLVDLNTLVAPTSGWTLKNALTISDNDWVAGYGRFDPDLDGPLAAYDRSFLINVSTSNTWSGSSGGDWNDASQWRNRVAPYALVDARFTSAATQTITFAAAGVANRVTVTAGDVTLVPGNQTLAASGDLVISDGTLSIPNTLTVNAPSAGEIGVGGAIQLAGGMLSAGSIVRGTTTARFNWTGGTLNLAGGAITGSAVFGVPATGVLSGNGSIVGDLSIGGAIAPGNSIGTLSSSGSVMFTSGGEYLLELSPAAGQSDLLIAGSVLIDPTATLTRTLITGSDVVLARGTVVPIVDYAATESGAFAELPEGTQFNLGLNEYQISYNGHYDATGTAHTSDTAVTLTVVPEPASLGLLVIGAAGLLRRRRRM